MARKGDTMFYWGLASFCRKSIRYFSTIAAPLTDCLKKGQHHWEKEQQEGFSLLKNRLCSTSTLALPNFDKVF